MPKIVVRRARFPLAAPCAVVFEDQGSPQLFFMARIFDHVDLRVRSLVEAGGFYRALLPLLGFTVRVDIEGWIQFESAGEGATEFFGVTEDQNHVPNRTRTAFWAETRERVDALAAEISRLGAGQIEGPGFESDSYYAVYFNDPSGNPLEICHRTSKFNLT